MTIKSAIQSVREPYTTSRSAELLKQYIEPVIRADYAASRLNSCGVVYHERLSNGECWIGPPERHPDGIGKVKVLPLTDVTPKPFMKVFAPDGEKYEIPYDFHGDWFAVVSLTGKPLIPA